MDIVQMRRGMGTSGSAPLPYDAEVEYLQSIDKNQYIYTDVKVIGSYTYEIDILPYTSGNGYYPFGCYASLMYGFDPDYQYFALPYTQELRRNTAILPSRQRYKMVISPDGLLVNGVLQSSTYLSSWAQNTYGIALFGRRSANGGIQNTGQTRIYSFKVTNGTESIIDLIPVRVGQVGYMYDKVSGQLFGNIGTGDFVLGPDK